MGQGLIEENQPVQMQLLTKVIFTRRLIFTLKYPRDEPEVDSLLL